MQGKWLMGLAVLPLMVSLAQADTLKRCEREADSRRLSGLDRKQFLGDCVGSKLDASRVPSPNQGKASSSGRSAPPPASAPPRQSHAERCRELLSNPKTAGDERVLYREGCLKSRK